MDATAVALLLLKASLVLVAALAGAYALRNASASQRHNLWSVAFAALVALPVLVVVLPALDVPVPRWNRIDETRADRIDVARSRPDVAPNHAAVASAEIVLREARGRSVELPSTRSTIIGLWLAGVIVALIGIVVSILRVMRLGAAGTIVDDPSWTNARNYVAHRLGITRRVYIVASENVVTPMAGGIVRPTVFVPAAATAWSAERRDVVLAHEMAHIGNGDPVRHLISRLAFALYWFHPLAWMAARRASAAREQACDETVIALGVRPSTYARVLLDFATTAPTRFPSAALPMVKRTLLEERLVAILDDTKTATLPRRAVMPTTIAVLLTLSLAAARPATYVRPLVDAPAPIVMRTSDAPAPAVFRRLAVPCWSNRSDGGSFRGSITMSDKSGRSVIYEQIGIRGDDHVIQRAFGDLRVCAIGEGLSIDRSIAPSAWSRHASRLVIETERPGDVRRMELEGGRVTFTVNGNTAPIDDNAAQWRDALFAVLDATWQLSELHGRVSSLRGDISSILGERSSLQGEISMLRGEISSMQGEISSLRGHESSLRGEISSLRGHHSSLQGQLSAERGAISSLEAARYGLGVSDRDRIDARIRRHRDNIRDVEEEIRRFDLDARVREVERRIADFNPDREAATIERRIREFDLDSKIAEVNRRIERLDVNGRIAGIEREIGSLDVDRRSADLESRRDAALTRLNAALGRR